MKIADCALTDEVFSFISASTGRAYHWNTSKVGDAFAVGTLVGAAHMYMALTEEDYLHVREFNGIEEHHLDTISAERMKTPVFIAEFPPAPGEEHPSHVIIDGNHRLVRAYRDGLRGIGAVLFSEESLQEFLIEDMPPPLAGYIAQEVLSK